MTAGAAPEPVLRIRQTNLRLLEEGCAASAWTKAVAHRDLPSGPEAQRGTAVHQVFARYVAHLYRTGRATDYEGAEDIAAAVLRESPRLTFGQRREVMQQARAIADGYLSTPANLYGTEEAFEATITLGNGARVVVTGTVDLLEVDDEEGVATLTDYKSSWAMPTDAQAREDFQLALYSLLVLDNLPNVEVVRGRLWYGRFGRMVPQKGDALWTREDVAELRAHLVVRLESFLYGSLRHEFTPGAWCQYCPRRRPGDCSLWKAYAGTTPAPIQTDYQAIKVARQILALEHAREGRVELLKPWCEEHGLVALGSGTKAERFGFHPSESVEFDAADVWELLSNPATESKIGPAASYLGIFRVDKRNRTWRDLEKALGAELAALGRPKTSTRFGHKGGAE